MPKHDYLFVDESGDPGYRLDLASGELVSTPYYTAAVLHLTDDAFVHINRHMAAFRYYSGMNRELKLPREQPAVNRLLEPIGELSESGESIWASAVYLDKRGYTGYYLKGERGRSPYPARFRNFVLRRLLEHHFRSYAVESSQYELVLDRFEMTLAEEDELRSYLAENYDIPTPTRITHASSIYVEGLQLVHHIANGFRDAPFGRRVSSELAFVNARDITKGPHQERGAKE